MPKVAWLMKLSQQKRRIGVGSVYSTVEEIKCGMAKVLII